eukprot:scaffold18796_cov66-Skeletonema_marinoi.AAC.1
MELVEGAHCRQWTQYTFVHNNMVSALSCFSSLPSKFLFVSVSSRHSTQHAVVGNFYHAIRV